MKFPILDLYIDSDFLDMKIYLWKVLKSNLGDDKQRLLIDQFNMIFHDNEDKAARVNYFNLQVIFF